MASEEGAPTNVEVENVHLFEGVLNGSPHEHQEKLKELKEVDVRNGSNSTLLHVAVRHGRVEWVEVLLSKGADPTLRDVDQLTAVRLAEEMGDKHPESAERKVVRQLVRLAASVREAALLTTGSGTDEASQQKSIVVSSDSPFDRIESIISSLSQEMLFVRETIIGVDNGQSTRDSYLETLDERVTKLMQVWRPLMDSWSVVKKELSHQIQDGEKVNIIYERFLKKMDPYAEIRRKGVDAMMEKTVIMDSDQEKISLVEGFYESLYSESRLTSSLLNFLQYEAGLAIWIDCKSSNIGKMKKRVISYDLGEYDGKDYNTIVDFEEKIIYLGALVDENIPENLVISCLAHSLAQMAVYLAFKNNGRPYNEFNFNQKKEYKAVIKEALSKGGTVHSYIQEACRKGSEIAREVEVISAVPRMVGYLGSKVAISRLRRQLPSLLVYYEDYVLKRISHELQLKRADLEK